MKHIRNGLSLLRSRYLSRWYSRRHLRQDRAILQGHSSRIWAVWLILLILQSFSSAKIYSQQPCNCQCDGQWVSELIPPHPNREVVAFTEQSGENRYCEFAFLPRLCLDGFKGTRVTGSLCENLEWGWDYWLRDDIRQGTECLEPLEVSPCHRYWRRIENVRDTQTMVFKCIVDEQELCREQRHREKFFFAKYQVSVSISDCECVPLPKPISPEIIKKS